MVSIVENVGIQERPRLAVPGALMVSRLIPVIIS